MEENKNGSRCCASRCTEVNDSSGVDRVDFLVTFRHDRDESLENRTRFEGSRVLSFNIVYRENLL